MTGILEVLYCVLIESPEVLNIIQENHIKSIISLLDKHGRNHKVRNIEHCLLRKPDLLQIRHCNTSNMKLRSSTRMIFVFWKQSPFSARSWMCSALCVCVTGSLWGRIRTSSQRICFLVVTSCYKPTLSTMWRGGFISSSTLQIMLFIPRYSQSSKPLHWLFCSPSFSMRPNIFLGTCEGSTQYKKWYFEVMVDHVEPFLTAQPYHLRVGWALTEGYSPYPGGGEGWGGNGVGDDLYSYGFDGINLWSGKVNMA